MQQPSPEHLTQGLLDSVCRAAVHTFDGVTVGIQRLRYGAVPQIEREFAEERRDQVTKIRHVAYVRGLLCWYAQLIKGRGERDPW